MLYRVILDDAQVGATDWLPLAQAAWDRATRDRDAAQHGGEAVLLIDGQVVASVQPRTKEGHPWPEASAPVVGPRELAGAVMQLLRHSGIDARAVAQQLTTDGLPTTPARLKSITTNEAGRRAHVSHAEILAICYAGISLIKNRLHSPQSGL